MKVEMLKRLKEELLSQLDDDSVVVITTKRSFLPEENNLFINPRYRKKSEILATINNERVVNKAESNIERTLTNSIKYGKYNSQRIEESFFVAIVMDRRKYEEKCTELQEHSAEEILDMDIFDNESLKLIDDIVMIQPCMISCYANPKNREDHLDYVAVEPVTYVHFNDFYRQMEELGYQIEIKDSERVHESSKHSEPFDRLVDFVMSNNFYNEDFTRFDYATNILITADLTNTKEKDKGTSKIRTR